MAVKSVDQISIVDVTDAYSVILTSEAHAFPGTTNAAKAGSTTTQGCKKTNPFFTFGS